MGWLRAFLILVAGCTFNPPGSTSSDDGGGDDMDAGTDGNNAACERWMPRAEHVKPCEDHYPAAGPWTVSGTVILDTSNGKYTNETGTEIVGPASKTISQQGVTLRVISVDSFAVSDGAKLRLVGAHPVLILSWSTMMIAGEIDASSRRDGATVEIGAGGSRAGCTGADGQGSDHSGGGGGGGFGDAGGDGGNGGNNDPTRIGGGGSGSTAVAVVAGGCRGGRGGTGMTAGLPGESGGAVQLTAKESIVIESAARIHSGGMGGQGGQGDGGGGGGGSGGYIGVDAPSVSIRSGAVLAANGGGGGAGCNGGSGPNGSNGSLGTSEAGGGQATGCLNATEGGAGGARDDTTGDDGAESNESGGGGGGGVGYILVWRGSGQTMGLTSPRIQNGPTRVANPGSIR